MSTGHAPSEAVATLARRIVRPGTVVTWLNHWSIQHADWEALSRVHCIGVDGTLLQLLLRRAGYPLGRTSADLVLPVFFREVLPEGSTIAVRDLFYNTPARRRRPARGSPGTMSGPGTATGSWRPYGPTRPNCVSSLPMSSSWAWGRGCRTRWPSSCTDCCPGR